MPALLAGSQRETCTGCARILVLRACISCDFGGCKEAFKRFSNALSRAEGRELGGERRGNLGARFIARQRFAAVTRKWGR